MGIKMKCKRLYGGSSPTKEARYKSHTPIAEKHKLDKLNRQVKNMNKKAEKKGLTYKYKLREVEVKDKKTGIIRKIYNIVRDLK